MLDENTYYGQAEAGWPGTSREAMNVRLNEIDRSSIDQLLSGDAKQSDAVPSSVMERVTAVRRLLKVLDAMPAEEPSRDLTQATLRRILAAQAPGDQSSAGASANL